jgi:hypothetical protein
MLRPRGVSAPMPVMTTRFFISLSIMFSPYYRS